MVLKERMQRFVDAYIETGNARISAIKAGYSEHTAHAMGSRLVRNPKIVEVLQHLTAKTEERHEITLAEVVRRLGEDGKHPDVNARIKANSRLLTYFAPAGPIVDQSQHIHLPEGLTLEELRRLARGD